MKQIPLICLFVVFTIGKNAVGQSFDCLSGSQSSQSTFTSMSHECPLADLSAEEIQELPNITIYVNIHFVGSPAGNFYPGEDDDYSPTNGNIYADLMLGEANDILDNPATNPIGIEDFQGDARYNYELYSDPNNPDDLYGGIWYWDSSDDLQFPYGSSVLNIVIQDIGDPGSNDFSGNACGRNLCNRLNLFDAYDNAANGGQWQWWNYGRLLNHESGHVFGLCHSFDCDNACSGIDIDVAAECNINPCFNGACGTDPGTTCDNWNSGSRNMMGYNNSQRAFSPCQWEIIYSNLINVAPEYALFCEQETNSLIIPSGSNTTWDHFKIIRNQEVIIEPGATLNITCEVRMVEDAKFEVKKGAKLVVNNGTITTLCRGGMWGGIDVHGDPNLSQSPTTNQGMVEFIDATIEYAHNAVSLSNNGWGTTGGGIIQATNTTFRNNKRSTEFINYPNYDNISFYDNCTFTLDDDYQLSGHSGQITMWQVKGVEIKNCTFENNVASMSDRGNAIYTIDAGYSVTEGSSFDGFKAGVYGTNGSSVHTFVVDDATFTNNALGVYAGSVDNIQVTRCTLEVGQYRVYPTYNHGIFIDQSTGYIIQENVLTGHNIMNSPKPVGILCYHTGDDHNLIYKNSFTDLYAANKADGDNRDNSNNFKGLEYQCNLNNQDNSQDDYDFYILLDYNYDIYLSGIRYYQGYYYESAGNTFSLDNSPSASDFRNATVQDIVYYYDNDPGENPLNTLNVNKMLTSYSNECASMLSSMMIVQGDLPQLESEFSTNQQAVDEKEATFEANLDGGDTEGLIAEIQATAIAEAGRLQSRLLDLAPWVSAEALTALFERPGLLPEAALTDILKANPDVLSYHPLVDKAREQLPAEKVDEALSHAREQITERARLEMELAGHIAAISLAANRALNYHLNETPIDLAAVRTWLDRKNSLVAAYGQFDAWIHDGKAGQAMAALRAIPEEFELLAHQREAYSDFERLANLKAQLVREGRYWNELDNAEIALLESLAEKDFGRAAVQAKGILNFFYNRSYDTQQLPFEEEAALRSETGAPDDDALGIQQQQEVEKPVKAIPNPAAENVLFQYQLPAEPQGKTALEITDINGRLIRRIPLSGQNGSVEWNSRVVQPGVYLYRWVSEGQVMMVDRLVITR